MVHVLEQRGDIGLDFEGFESEERAAEYAAQMQERLARLRRDDDPLAFERNKRKARSLRDRLRRYVAQSDGIDVSVELEAVEDAVEALAASVERAPERV